MAVVGTALTWAAAWGGVGAIFGLLLWILDGDTCTALTVFGSVILFAPFSFLAGAISSLVLGIAERRRTFDEMSLPRFAFGGTVGGLLLSMLFFLGGGGGLRRLVDDL